MEESFGIIELGDEVSENNWQRTLYCVYRVLDLNLSDYYTRILFQVEIKRVHVIKN